MEAQGQLKLWGVKSYMWNFGCVQVNTRVNSMLTVAVITTACLILRLPFFSMNSSFLKITSTWCAYKFSRHMEYIYIQTRGQVHKIRA